MQTRAAIDSLVSRHRLTLMAERGGLLVAPLLAPAGPPLWGVIPASSLSQSPDRCRQKFTYRLAERVGFEPTNTVRCYTLSRRAPSTARPPLHAAARVPEDTKAIKSAAAPNSKAAVPAAPGGGPAEPPASRWPPYWAEPPRNAAERRDMRLSAPVGAVPASRPE